MCFRLSLVVLLVIVIAVIIPLAYLDGPDPIWISGIYDDVDEDATIVLIYANLNSIESAPLYVAGSSSASVDLVFPQCETFAPLHIFSLDPSRVDISSSPAS